MSKLSQSKTLFFIVFLAGLISFVIFSANTFSSISLESQQHTSVPDHLSAQTNPRPKKIERGLASKPSEQYTKAEEKDEEDENNDDNPDSYSLNDPNLYESDFSGVNDLDVIGQINDQIN